MSTACPLARITATLVVQMYYIAAHLPSLERESFPPFRAPIVDNFSCLPRNSLQDNTPRKSKLFGVLYNIVLVSFFSENKDSASLLDAFSVRHRLSSYCAAG